MRLWCAVEVALLDRETPNSLNPEENGFDLPTGAEDITITLDKPGGFRTNLEGDIEITEFLPPGGSPIFDAVMISIDMEVVPEPSSLALCALSDPAHCSAEVVEGRHDERRRSGTMSSGRVYG